MTKKIILEHFESLGVRVLEMERLRDHRNYYRILTDQEFLDKALARKIVNMPCFVQICVTWGGWHPRMIIYVNRDKSLQ